MCQTVTQEHCALPTVQNMRQTGFHTAAAAAPANTLQGMEGGLQETCSPERTHRELGWTAGDQQLGLVGYKVGNLLNIMALPSAVSKTTLPF